MVQVHVQQTQTLAAMIYQHYYILIPILYRTITNLVSTEIGSGIDGSGSCASGTQTLAAMIYQHYYILIPILHRTITNLVSTEIGNRIDGSGSCASGLMPAAALVLVVS